MKKALLSALLLASGICAEDNQCEVVQCEQCDYVEQRSASEKAQFVVLPPEEIQKMMNEMTEEERKTFEMANQRLSEVLNSDEVANLLGRALSDEAVLQLKDILKDKDILLQVLIVPVLGKLVYAQPEELELSVPMDIA